jgi:hypothetical protein
MILLLLSIIGSAILTCILELPIVYLFLRKKYSFKKIFIVSCLVNICTNIVLME